MLISFLSFFSVFLVLFWCWGVLVSFDFSVGLFGLGVSSFLVDFFFDLVGSVSLVMLFFCGSVALFYCYHYFGGHEEASILYPLMVFFLVVMGVLVTSGKLLLSLMLWEYLGLVSFFLIMFYSKMSSLRASLITVFASRFGDVSIFILMMWFSYFFKVSVSVVVFLSCLVVLTKSACFPFVSWLLEAMRAPTPVSSLVHSSTLVAAGVWFLFRYCWLFGANSLSCLFIFSMLTVFMSGFCALFFFDLKKLVALSTCNNISWCLLFYICGDLGLSLLQLLTHGVCKCYLFMSVGDLMSSSGSSQSSVGVYLSRYSGIFGGFVQTVLIFSLCGVPFMGVFFSKHGLFSEVLYIYGLGYLLFLFCGLFLSYAYSFRLVLLLLGGRGGLVSGYISYFFMSVFLSSLGCFINLVGFGVLGEYLSLSVFYSLFIFFLQVGGCLFGWLFYLFSNQFSTFFVSSLFCSDGVVKSFYDYYMSFSVISYLSFYRWEPYLLGLFKSSGEYFSLFLSTFTSFKIMIFSVLFIVFFSLGVIS